MVGQPRQQRAAWHVGDGAHVVVEAAFLAHGRADIRQRGVVAPAGEVEEDAVRREILDLGGLQVLDRGEVAAVQQRDPVIIGADMHPPLVGADGGSDIVACFDLAGRRRIEVVGKLAVAVHVTPGPTPLSAGAQWRSRLTKALSITG